MNANTDTAIQHAIRYCSTRCAELGNIKYCLGGCKVRTCDFRSRYEAHLAGQESAKDTTEILVSEQTWCADYEHKRILIVDSLNRGSVQIELPRYKHPDEGWIYALWVDLEHRHSGIGTRLLDKAEQTLRERGYKYASLDWSEIDSPVWVIRWYIRRGYDEKEFDGRGTYSLLKKEL